MEPQNDAPDTGVSLLDYFQIFQRRRQIIMQAFLVIACVTVVITMLTKPVYEATAQLLVEAPSNSLSTVDTGNSLSQLLVLTQPQTVDTQVQVLQSPTLIDEVCQETGVKDSDITITAVKETNVIQVVVDADTRAKAANAANTLLNDYINEDVNRSLTEIQAAEQFVQQRSDDVEQQLSQSEAALEAFKLKYHVADVEQEQSNKLGQVQDLETALNQQQANLSALTSQISAERQLIGGVSPSTDADTTATNPAIQDLRSRIGDLQTQRASLLQPGGYGPNAPAVKILDGQISSLQNRLAKLPPYLVTINRSTNPELDSVRDKIIDLELQQAAVSAEVTQTASQLTAERNSLGSYASWETALEQIEPAT